MGPKLSVSVRVADFDVSDDFDVGEDFDRAITNPVHRSNAAQSV
jgi:hypothetical protein